MNSLAKAIRTVAVTGFLFNGAVALNGGGFTPRCTALAVVFALLYVVVRAAGPRRDTDA